DLLLAGVFITNLEQADDVMMLSLNPTGAQNKMTAFWKWCRANFMIINAIKSFLMIFGTIPRSLPSFSFGQECVSIVTQTKYVGFNLNSTKRNIFADHYEKKASKARVVAQTMLGLESTVGVIPVWEARKMYSALVDPHLTHGCEISLDVDLSLLSLLESVQVSFLRRVLGLNKRSVIAPLYTETGLMPLRFRRVILALNHLRYLTTLKNTGRYVRLAEEDSVNLSDEGKASWVMDLQYVIHNLPFGPFRITLPNLSTACIDNPDSPKLYLLRGRLEPEKDSAPIQKPLHFRHYLNVVNPKHRKALTRLLLSSHCLAIERLRWVELRRPRIDPRLRVCRFCKAEIETPEHALLECTASAELITLRNDFMARMNKDIRKLPALNSMPVVEFLKLMISYRQTIALVSKFAYEVTQIYYATPKHIPPLPVHWLIQPPQPD
ncbi:hypothetical protein K438DRAFT_1569073, partial [Mycena galopus ATCC 62051]